MTVGVAGLLVFYAIGGGTYDVVDRGAAGVVIWWALLLGLALGVFPRMWPRREVWLVLVAGGLLSLWTLLSLTWTESSERTTIELARVAHHLGLLALVVCVLRPSTVRAALGGVTLAGVVVCGLALASRLWPDAFPADRVAAAFQANRLNYPLNYWNAVAAWGAMTTALALAWSAHSRKAVLRAFALAAVPLAVTVDYLTYSRAGVGGVVIAVGVLLLAARTRAVMVIQIVVAGLASFVAIEAVRGAPAIAEATGTDGRGTVLLLLAVGMAGCAAVAVVLHALSADDQLRMPERIGRPAIAGAVVVAVIVGAVVLPPVVSRAADEFNQTTIAADTDDPAARLTSAGGNRNNLWTSALDAFDSARFEGTGPGTFEFWWNRQGVDGEHVKDAHSLYVEALAESGWPGFLLIIALCGGLTAVALRVRVLARGRSRAGAAVAALSVFVVWLFHAGVDWMWEETAVTAVALIAAGCACVALRGSSRRRPGVGFRVAATAVCIAAIVVQLPPLVGTSRVRSSQQELRAGDLLAARASADDAVNAWPWASAPYVQRALVGERAGDLSLALRDIREAQRREPTNWRHPLLLTRIELERGDVPAAFAAYRQARRLRPLATVFQRR